MKSHADSPVGIYHSNTNSNFQDLSFENIEALASYEGTGNKSYYWVGNTCSILAIKMTQPGDKEFEEEVNQTPYAEKIPKVIIPVLREGTPLPFKSRWLNNFYMMYLCWLIPVRIKSFSIIDYI